MNNRVDPEAEKYYIVSLYAYCANNPVRFIDPGGKDLVDLEGNKITYSDKNGWSSNAYGIPPEEYLLGVHHNRADERLRSYWQRGQCESQL